ncbi:hypothetical protein RJ640_021524 [Escallonia rubra]|uniref:Integrase catalytic domain-containing protein n=2 Tax=Magnoliopsida TaxID=3398 RepID=A0AA88QP33_9ASTE|nr:hypothetical protein RJ640_021524 [Escallonia rubra]
MLASRAYSSGRGIGRRHGVESSKPKPPMLENPSWGGAELNLNILLFLREKATYVMMRQDRNLSYPLEAGSMFGVLRHQRLYVNFKHCGFVTYSAEVQGYDVRKEKHLEDEYFGPIVHVIAGQPNDYHIQEGFLFMGLQLRVPDCSPREKIIIKQSAIRHFGFLALPRTQPEWSLLGLWMVGFQRLAYFVPCRKTMDASSDAYLCFKEKFRLHGNLKGRRSRLAVLNKDCFPAGVRSNPTDCDTRAPADAPFPDGGAISSSDWVWGVRRLGAAAVDMCHVALGIVEAYWEYRLKPWDMAAGVLLALWCSKNVTEAKKMKSSSFVMRTIRIYDSMKNSDWSKTVRIYMRSVGEDDHLSSDPPTDDTKRLWLREDARLILQIRNSIDSEILGLINHCEFVKELMDYLEFLYSGKGNISRIYDVCRAFYRPEKETKTLTAFFMDFKKTYEELNMLLPFSKDIKVQHAQREQMAAMSFLGALPPEFDTAKSQILSGTDITSLQEVFSRVLRTESTFSNQQSSVLVANRGRGSEAGRMNNNKGDRGGGDRGGHNGGTSEIILPSLAFNLMSDLMTKQTIGKGHVSDGLYILDAWVPRSVACSGVVSPFEAHCRLGHPSLPVLKKLCPQFHDISSVDCESCHFAKHHRSSLSPRVNKRVEFAFELVHSDVWGPCPILAKSGFRYFVTFVDDFSRMTWIYFMKNRSEVFAHFSAFCAEIKTQFNVHVHILRSDNAKEYMSGSFQNYMNQHGILHQSSCTDTPAQNGVAERKNRHLLETARALLFQMKVPKPFWADAISTACFLINRMPSTVLHGDVPYSVLFPTKPLFPVEPRIFGSTCFVRDVRPHLTKLDPKALKCVFLGYSRLQKGYRCYSPDLHKYLVSTDVVFSEHSQFFSSKFHSSSKGEDDDWLMYEIFPSVPIEPAISEDRTREDGLSVPVSVPVEPSNATDGANSGVAQSEDVNCLGEQAIIPSAPVKPPIVQVYSRRREHHDTCPAPIPSSSDPSSNDLDLPIGLRKGDDCTGITSLKKFLQTKFHTKDLGQLKYFLGIEVTRSKKGIFLSQRKYVLDLLVETGKAGAKPCNTPMNPSVHLTKDDGDRLDDPEKYRRLVGKLNYLIVTRPDIAYAVSTVSQFMSEPTVKHWAALEQILCYLKGAPGLGLLYSNHGHSYIECFSDADWAGSKLDRKSTTGYCVFVGGNLVSWKSKKQSVVSRSSAESEYRAMAQSTCEVMWICHLLEEISLKPPLPAKLWCDNQAARHIASNPVYHERTKHIEVDCHFIREKIQENLISTSYVKTGEQLGDILTKSLNGTRVEYLCNKLGMINIYAPA